jgi:hypothetical protein
MDYKDISFETCLQPQFGLTPEEHFSMIKKNKNLPSASFASSACPMKSLLHLFYRAVNYKKMISDFNQNTVEVILSNELGYERIAMDCSASFAKIFGCPADRIEDLKTVVAEAATNAMQHGNQGRANAKVTIFMDFKDDTPSMWLSSMRATASGNFLQNRI